MIPDINLLPQIEKAETSSKLTLILIGILTLVTVLILGWMYTNAKSDLSSVTAEHDALVVKRDTLQAEVASNETMTQGTLEESIAFVERVSYPVTPVVDETQDLLPGNTYLRSYEFSETGGRVEVDFETLNSIASYVSNLENSLIFEDIQVGTIHNFELDPTEEEKNEEEQFTEVPRYTVEINFVIDRAQVAAGGGR